MSINPTSVINVKDSLFDFLKTPGIEAFVPRVYSDSEGIPTLGVGYALVIDSWGPGGWGIRDKLGTELQSIGITLSTADKAMLKKAADKLNHDPCATNPIPTWHAGENSANLNVMSFGLITSEQGRALSDQIISTYEGRVKKAIGQTAFNQLSGTSEIVALLSLAYNLKGFGSNTPTLMRALGSGNLQNGNRAEAWFQMRYNLNGNQLAGLANRRYRESEFFGLYNPNLNNLGDDEAKSVVAMFTRHRTEIEKYEAKYSPATTIANTLPAITKIALADQILIDHFGLGTNIQISQGAVQVASEPNFLLNFNQIGLLTGTDVTNTKNPTGNDLLLGAVNRANRIDGKSGDDVIYGGLESDELSGGAGADTLIGGQGDDELNGGAGDDTYILKSGEGKDTIRDSDGTGAIKYTQANNAVVTLSGGIKVGKGANAPDVWESADHKTSYTLINGDNSTQKDLVIHFADDPAGSLIIKNFDKNNAADFHMGFADGPPQEPHTQTNGTPGSDSSYNGAAGPALVASTASEEILGGGGADEINLSFDGDIGHGGDDNDRLTTGTGAVGTTHELHGDAGNDILVASAGNDQLYGGTGSDFLSGGADDDYLDGGEGNDFIDGGLGGDVIEGGAGDDVILGGGTKQASYTGAAMMDGSWQAINADGSINLAVGGVIEVAGDAGNIIDAGAGNDTVFGGEAGDVIEGGEGNDQLNGLAGDDQLQGGDGDDILTGGHRRRLRYRQSSEWIDRFYAAGVSPQIHGSATRPLK